MKPSWSRSEWQAGQVLIQAAKLVLFMRLLANLPMVLTWRDEPPTPFAVVFAALTTATTLALILTWSVVVPFIVKHPATVLLDVTLSTVLAAVSNSSIVYTAYLACGAFLVGMLFEASYRHLITILIIVVYATVIILNPDGAHSPPLIVSVPVWATIITLLVCVHMGATLRTLQWRIDAALEQSAQSAHDAALGEERSRLARELHDSLTKTLVGIGLQATALRMKHPECAETAKTISHAANEAVKESRKILTDLRDGAQTPAQESLQQALEELGTLYDITVNTELELRHLRSSDPAAYVVRKIVEEAVINAAKHSGADQVDVVIRSLPGGITAIVSDRGTGMRRGTFDSSVGHYGLTGMRERAASIGGRVDIDSKPGTGTTISINAPLKGQEHDTKASNSHS